MTRETVIKLLAHLHENVSRSDQVKKSAFNIRTFLFYRETLVVHLP
ncbi:hypothetical protein SAMN05421688_1123 [Poseidonocella pacifica]|uniref:Uncharacterized protein n=1 Tax=Poseidonocella pacifica TaxID=871651 RepID=A0A1I0W870_9RHOB|nr:hypothetical protein SAMN05421688_1123 [Poseidonocella pacifica]